MRGCRLLVAALVLTAACGDPGLDDGLLGVTPSVELASLAGAAITVTELGNPWPGETDVMYWIGAMGSPYGSARNAMNDSGQVIGYGKDFFNADFSDHRIILWDRGRFGIFGSPPWYPAPFAINNNWEIAGVKGAPMGAFVLAKNGTVRSIDGEPRGSGLTPLDINNKGQVVLVNAAGEALLWDHDEVKNLGEGIPWAINDRGRIVGQSGGMAVMWKDGNKVELFEGVAYAINSSSQVVGMSGGRAVLWSYGKLTDLGPGAAYGINDRVKVVGTSGGRAVLWSQGVVTDLGPGLASAINNNHQILVGSTILSNPWW